MNLARVPRFVFAAAGPLAAVAWLAALLTPPARAVDGALDTTFQTPNGYRAFDAIGLHRAAKGTLDPDGRAVYVGERADEISWAAVESSGAPSVCSFAPPSALSATPAQAIFDGEGRLLVTGTAEYTSLGRVIFVARFLYPACTLDTSFDGDGYFTFDHADPLEGLGIGTVRILVGLEFVERIVVGGELRPTSGSDPGDVLLLRLRADGTLDSGFADGDGWRRVTLGNATERFGDLEIDSLQRIVLGVLLFDDSDSDWFIVRTLANGDLDTTLNGGGWKGLGSIGNDEAAGGVAIGGDGRIWSATALRDHASDPDLVRLRVQAISDNGALQAGTGWTYVDELAVADLVVQGDGRAIVLGDTTDQDGDRDLFVTACRPSPPTSLCFWEEAFGPLNDHLLAHPLPDLAASGAERAGGIALAAGRPILFADATPPVLGRLAVVARLTNAYIFADGFETGTRTAWD